ncbi:hypothetical protein C4588_02965 [Candidatus Parcubacteria bacterium]|nr:MAG: hypothetical protein C4588_02965 [Candidatus Parcubacteria bacterium]
MASKVLEPFEVGCPHCKHKMKVKVNLDVYTCSSCRKEFLHGKSYLWDLIRDFPPEDEFIKVYFDK